MESHWCPCPSSWESTEGGFYLDVSKDYDDFTDHRRLQEEESAPQGETWEMVYVGAVLFFMFAALLSDRIGADLVMLAALTACMAANIVTVSEGVSGFSNEGVLTVLVLFVVAAGIQLTGGLDWYMAKLLGRPVNIAGAQLRLMIPIAIISAFLNNTPVVVIMIPICQKWGKNTGISPSQLLVPLSFASILGGTCTLIGTSTNLVVAGLLKEAYPDDPNMQVGLFDLGEFGVPVALIGMSYIIIASPYLLPGGKRKGASTLPEDDDGTILLGARLTKWSPAAGRTVKRSGLRDTGGVYLVSVYRARSGNIHRAVGQEFVLNVDDILYFTGMVKEFSQFCSDNALEVITNEVDIKKRTVEHNDTGNNAMDLQGDPEEERQKVVKFASTVRIPGEEFEDDNNEVDDIEMPPSTISTKSARPSFFSVEAEKSQAINRLTDMIRGYNPSEPLPEEFESAPRESRLSGPAKVVVAVDAQDLEDVVLVGINANDRPGLLLEISRGLHTLGLQLHHTEASVIKSRSVSIWRCALIDEGGHPDASEMQAVLSSLLENEGGAGATKSRGLLVIRTMVTDQSRLLSKTLEDVNFRETYKAAFIAVQRNSRSSSTKKDKSELDDLTGACFAAGDILVLQADDDSPLLVRPPPDFYAKSETHAGYKTFFNKAKSVGGLKLSSSSNNLKGENPEDAGDDISVGSNDTQTMEAWRDLRVLFYGKEGRNLEEDSGNSSREFLAAVEVCKKSEHISKTVAQAGLDRQAGLMLVGVERPFSGRQSMRVSFARLSVMPGPMSPLGSGRASINGSVNDGSEMVSITQDNMPTASIPVPPEGHLKEGDILWFAGPATAIADLRKIPGLVSLEDEELKKIDEKVHDRRLVQAVVARKGPLVGKTAAEAGFRTRYGAAVIAVHRDGTRVQDHPGNIKLQSGDVLLLEAGPTFISRNTDNQQSFALISEVKDSKPPRLALLIPALVLVLSMLIIVAIGPALFPDQNMASLLVCGLVVAFIMVCLGILSQQECRDAVNWEVYVTIACAFGIGKAMENSGLASLIADGLVKVGYALGIGYAGLYGAVYLATFLISNIVTNNAAAALMFPIAIDAAEQTGADPLLMSYNIMLAASASFMSPYGYTTNLLIYGPGGYKVKDFVYMGTPMQGKTFRS
mmetsp:Transcript_25509/g.54881  ORF Transcript_25509/g.54881 Transcript_25509/m.54881 type:complete len:1149 (+) Transcript_25509:308-3754(+)